MSAVSVSSSEVRLTQFHFPRTVIARFVARRTIRGAVLWAVVFGIYVASKAIGFVDIYSTAAARTKIAATFSNNVGIEILLGSAKHASNTAGYVAWNTLAIISIVAAIWAILVATKYFRGEEDNGRWELLLAGQTTSRRAIINAFSGLLISFSVFYIIMMISFTFVGKSRGVDFNTSAAAFFALAGTLAGVIFMSIGAFFSQLMATRAKAIGVTLGVFVASFLLRAVADITSAHWLSYFTPLGWIENLQPLTGSKPIWLVPILGLIMMLVIATIYFAGKRDLGSSIVADKDTSRPHLALLNSPLGLSLRLTRGNIISWLSAIFISALFYGFFTKSSAQAFNQSASARHVLGQLAHNGQVNVVLGFLGVVFFLQMVIVMAYVASALVSIRQDEAEGYLDNILVQPYGRLRWLLGRTGLVTGVTILAGMLTCLAVWIGVSHQVSGVSFQSIVLASINCLVPAALTLGAGIFAIGLVPRLTVYVAYGVLAWSFLIDLLSSGVKLNHWILDTSILNHIVFAPAASPNWMKNLVILMIAIVLGLVGFLRFNRRDLQLE